MNGLERLDLQHWVMELQLRHPFIDGLNNDFEVHNLQGFHVKPN